jgi:hypothetical protein
LDGKDPRLVECMGLLEETGDFVRCLELYPDLGQELREFVEAARSLSALAPPSPSPELRNSGRRLLLSSLSQIRGGTPMWQRIVSNKTAAIAAAAALFVLGTVGAGAATGHGEAVSEAVHKAKEWALGEDGDGRVGPAVSEAACEAAHNSGTLPDGAQDAPGHNKDPEDQKDCTHPSNAEAEEDDGESGDDENGNEDEPKNHGDAVSDAVHDAKDEALGEDGDGRVGPAVSEAACEAAHGKETLPDGAKDAPGHNKDPEKQKDCTHPSNAGEDAGGAENGSGHGKESAPGQQKKQ